MMRFLLPCLLLGLWQLSSGCAQRQNSEEPGDQDVTGPNDCGSHDENPCTTNSSRFGFGDFLVEVPGGAYDPALVALKPVVYRDESLPESITLAPYEVLVTRGGPAYTVETGTAGFVTDRDHPILLVVPFDAGTIPEGAGASLPELNIRIGVPSEERQFSVLGRIDGDKLVAELLGLPASFTVAAVFNPFMAAHVHPEPGVIQNSLQSLSSPVSLATPWCVIYDERDPLLLDAAQKYFALRGPPDREQVATVAELASAAAESALEQYLNAGFREPLLVKSKKDVDPCGFLMKFLVEGYSIMLITQTDLDRNPDLASSYRPPSVPWAGMIYISPKDLIGKAAESACVDEYSVLNVVSHEILHAIQWNYRWASWAPFTRSLMEGTATTYGQTFDSGNPLPLVRRMSAGEQYRLSAPLLACPKSPSVECYSSQDFFAYIGRKYSTDGTLSYLSQLFEAIDVSFLKDGIAQSPSQLFRWMDEFLTSNLHFSLRNIYLDFVIQRAFQHNDESRFCPGWDLAVGSGTDKRLFVDWQSWTNLEQAGGPGWRSVIAVADNGPQAVSFSGSMQPLSAAGLEITVGGQNNSCRLVVNYDPSGSGFPAGLQGRFYRFRASTGTWEEPQELSTMLASDDFGEAADRAFLLLANLDYAQVVSPQFQVECRSNRSTWTDPTSGLTWWEVTTILNSEAMDWDEARTHCANLSVDGGGWHLPTINELRTLIRNCPETEDDGICNVREGDCLALSCRDDTSCNGCWYQAPFGGYWPDELAGWNGSFWSSSRVEDLDDSGWYVDAQYVEVDYEDIRVRVGVLCVR